MEVAVEARLVDRVDRADAHRDGGELPEVGHEARVRVRRKAVAAEFAAEVVELLFAQAAFHVGTGVHAGRGVALEVDQVADAAVVLAPEEVVPANVVEGGAEEAKVERWPPMPSCLPLARTTMAAAFQRL